ncbi:MAG: hypothetical protein AVDCRST_MAG67-3338 [uncultured Solirubrobacteraceae bacterium]|uniref:Uncharacterized protein n=1 Tax=uncultured Solirubrobacteraceae bacterium TaxID=1162706 RepID=A0A6J4TED4_9ACTN|nr:MAG: hypothetical protein AVDCRST_MAG67-3338 [uncultured Solirubrobacteraceae bacterium]
MSREGADFALGAPGREMHRFSRSLRAPRSPAMIRGVGILG